MNVIAHVRPHFLISFIAIFTLLALVACGSSDQPPATPQAESGSKPLPKPRHRRNRSHRRNPSHNSSTAANQHRLRQSPAPAPTNTPPAPTISAVVGQGAIGVVPTPIPTPTPVAVVEEPAGEPSITVLKVARGVVNNSSLDPALGGRGNFSWLEPMYEGMIFFDQYTDLRPMMATEWSTNDDFSVWTIQLRENVPLPQGLGYRERRRCSPFPGPGPSPGRSGQPGAGHPGNSLTG